uniref:Uncharacterized protein n=1 Tax=Anguilla anguilla TaxID=7936 RepID=A0A0E9RUR6_ANGAN
MPLFLGQPSFASRSSDVVAGSPRLPVCQSCLSQHHYTGGLSPTGLRV